MSFDLYFYARKDRQLDESAISDYLSKNLTPPNETGEQWFFENEDTGVYYSFDLNEENADPETIEWYESFSDFDNTRFSFNLNFIRPNFFGLEAFAFVEQLIDDLNLYIFDDQSRDPAAEKPRKDTAQSLYENWSRTNLSQSAAHFDEFGLHHYPLERSNDIWRYNFQKATAQARLGDDYFVPSVLFAKRATTGEVIALSTWTQHIPNVFPPADYFVLIRERKKLFRTIEETGVLSRESLLTSFKDYLEDFDVENSKIIHPDAAARSATVFDNVKFDFPLEGFFEPVELERITNAEKT